ncbi:glucokinase [Thiobacillus denitrificans]|uniref:glucokinase n=1 Tax=Thiobacillus denitrificans TaxID=36861 RepID=UPI001FDF1C97|nr:glucokinase [Thiobacillus denitrificans]
MLAYSSSMELIAGDIGGTKSWLAWVTGDAEGVSRPRFEKVYASADFASADALLRQFMAEAQSPVPPNVLLLALPGPLQAQRVKLTNLDWTLDAAGMAASLGIADVRFVNDFQAAAAGVATLTASDVIALNPRPADPAGVRAIIGAGTGMGLAFMVADSSGRYRSFASEGGHTDFAPGNALQLRLLEYLRAEYGHVSWERAVSGSAMNDLYRFCCTEQGLAQPGEPVDGAMLVARAGSGDGVAAAALDLFVALYGAWTGNVALLYQPRGGLYIAGGVSRHLQTHLQSPRFMAAAVDKGRMRGVVERTPVFLIVQPRLGVQGAIAMAFAPP